MAIVINYNEDAVRTLSKEEFLENQKHHAGDTDLSADYDRINPSKGKAPAKVEAKEPVKD